jgi:excisionase family DNA binding protein
MKSIKRIKSRITRKSMKNSGKDYVSTGQAAELCSVTPDTVLKWIKAGKLPANRTPGGHYRIPRETLLNVIETGNLDTIPETTARSFQFCWEYYEKNGDSCDKCPQCIVFRSRAKRCYELGQLPVESGHAHVFCKNTCDQCDYYQAVIGQPLNILVVTEHSELAEDMEKQSGEANFDLRLTDNEYHCSMMIESFRPDYVVIDSSLGKNRCRNFARYLAEDPRVPFTKIIVAGKINDMPPECEKMIFAIINKPFTREELEGLLDLVKNEI